MQKLWTIIRKDLYVTFSDRPLLVLMFIAPMALATIIGVTFGGISGDNAPVTDIPVAVVNLDTGTDNGNFGEIFVNVFAPSEPSGTELDTLLAGVVVDNVETARQGVDDGTYVAALIIPENYTQNSSPALLTAQIPGASVELYMRPDAPISTSIVRSVADSVNSSIASGSIALASVIQTLIETAPFSIANVTGSEAFTSGIAQVYSSDNGTVSVERQSETGEEVSFNPFVFIGSAQAIFFALFTANGGATSIIEERQNWTLQRLLITPTTRLNILLGKMTAVFFMVLVQLIFLFFAFTLIASLLAGEFQFIWGQNLFHLSLVVIAIAIASAGLGSIVAGVAKTAEQSGTIGSILAIGMAATGGAFGFNIGGGLENLSIVYWGSDALTQVAQNQGDIWLNVLIMTVFGVATFLVGVELFNRRLAE